MLNFALFDNGLTLKTFKLAFIGFCIQTLHVLSGIRLKDICKNLPVERPVK